MVIGLGEVGFSGLAGGGGGRKNMDAWIWDKRGPEAIPESSRSIFHALITQSRCARQFLFANELM